MKKKYLGNNQRKNTLPIKNTPFEWRQIFHFAIMEVRKKWHNTSEALKKKNGRLQMQHVLKLPIQKWREIKIIIRQRKNFQVYHYENVLKI